MPDEETVVLVRQYPLPAAAPFLRDAGRQDRSRGRAARRRRSASCARSAATRRGSGGTLTTFDPCIGYSDERIELYLAQDLTRVGDALDEGEFLEEVPLPLTVALDWVKTGRITDAKTIIGLLWVAKLL